MYRMFYRKKCSSNIIKIKSSITAMVVLFFTIANYTTDNHAIDK